MKKVFLLILALLFGGVIFANDTYFFTSGGNIFCAEDKDISVQMESEVIALTLQPDYYEVTVDFNFYNTGKTVELLVGFPFFEAGIGGHGKIYDFKCWTNGELTDFSDQPIIMEFSNTNFNGEELQNAYTRKVVFPAKKVTKTKVYYKSEYGQDTEGVIVKYLYGTGSSWKDDIGEITLIIENNLPYSRPVGFELPENGTSFVRLEDNKWQAKFYNVAPEYTDCITINARNILDDTGPRAFPSYGYTFSKKKAQPEWLFWYTKPQLRILRNTIYALHGYSFKSQDLKELFTSWGKYWHPAYKENPDFSENELSEIEKYNAKLLLEEENRR